MIGTIEDRRAALAAALVCGDEAMRLEILTAACGEQAAKILMSPTTLRAAVNLRGFGLVPVWTVAVSA